MFLVKFFTKNLSWEGINLTFLKLNFIFYFNKNITYYVNLIKLI